MVTILGMFLVQIGSPGLNKLACTQKLKSQSVVLAEVITHVVISLSSSVFAVVGLFSIALCYVRPLLCLSAAGDTTRP